MKRFYLDGWVCRGQNGARGVTTRQVQGQQGARCVTSFRVNSPTYNASTQTKVPHYFQCEYWHDPADRKAALIEDGACLMLAGDLDHHTWVDQQSGQQRGEVRLRVYEVARVFAPQAAAQGAYAPQGAPRTPQPAPQPAPVPAYAPQPAPASQPAYAPQGAYDDEIPF